jgi:hypothetical protein
MVPSFPRRLARLVLAGALVAVLGAASARPSLAVPSAPAAPCAYVTGGQAFFFNGHVQQLTISVDDPTGVGLQVRLSDGQTKLVPDGPDLTYFSGGAGTVRLGLYRPAPQDVNKTFPIYVLYHDPCKNVTWTFTVSLHVIP